MSLSYNVSLSAHLSAVKGPGTIYGITTCSSYHVEPLRKSNDTRALAFTSPLLLLLLLL